MTKQIKTIKIPKCPKCKKLMEVGFTTEQDKKSKGKPKVIICIGTCEKCKVRLVFDLIETDSLPSNPEELMNAINIQKKQKK